MTPEEKTQRAERKLARYREAVADLVASASLAYVGGEPEIEIDISALIRLSTAPAETIAISHDDYPLTYVRRATISKLRAIRPRLPNPRAWICPMEGYVRVSWEGPHRRGCLKLRALMPKRSDSKKIVEVAV